jgi:hypothetical protein
MVPDHRACLNDSSTRRLPLGATDRRTAARRSGGRYGEAA